MLGEGRRAALVRLAGVGEGIEREKRVFGKGNGCGKRG